MDGIVEGTALLDGLADGRWKIVPLMDLMQTS
jgi:hypothetical protein